MIQLRYLQPCTLEKVIRSKEPNGAFIDSYEVVKDYLVQPQEIADEVSASIYGANLNRMVRLVSPRDVMALELKELVNRSADNISGYVVNYDGDRYSIKAVRRRWIDLELL